MSLLNDACLKLPKGFTPNELLCMLDDDGDYILTHDEFVQSFYRLIDGGQFQQTCMIQIGINALKRLAKDSIQQNHETLQFLEALLKRQHSHSDKRLARIEASLRKLDGSGEVPAAPDDTDDDPKSSNLPFVSSRSEMNPLLGRQKKGSARINASMSLRALRPQSRPKSPVAKGEQQKVGAATLPPPIQHCEIAIAARQPAGGVVRQSPIASDSVRQPVHRHTPNPGTSLHASVASPPPTLPADSASSESEYEEVVIAWQADVVDSAKPDGYDVAVPALRLPRLGAAGRRPTSALSVR